MRVRTADRDGAPVLTVEQIGRTRELTPEGFLLCRDVRVARLGEMLYTPDEIPVDAGPDGIVRVTRDAGDLFRPETISSLLGKDVVDDHPDEDVNPENYQQTSCGVVLNPRAGEGSDDTYLLADLLIKNAAAIQAVQDGKREVSMGYDADYEQLEPGRGRQFNIIANHVALVDQGRCGPRCSIGDHDMRTRDKRSTWKDRLLKAFKSRDENAFKEELEKTEDEMTNGVEGDTGPDAEHTIVLRVEGPGPTQAVERQEETNDEEAEEAPGWFTKARAEDKSWRDGIEERLGKIEGAGTTDESAEEGEHTDPAERTDDEDGDIEEGKVYDEAADEDGEKKDGETKDGKSRDRASTGDSAGVANAFQDMIARAEILAPGIKLPTFDAKVARKVTLDRMCAFKRRALVKALEDEETAELLAPITGRGDLAKRTCDAIGTMFVAGSELVKRANSSVTQVSYVHDHDRSKSGPASIADINQKNRDFWAAKTGAAR